MTWTGQNLFRGLKPELERFLNGFEIFTAATPMEAEKGNAQAQFKLAFMYAEGRGVTKDEAQAALWYRKAAGQGHAAGQSNLKVVHAGLRCCRRTTPKLCNGFARQPNRAILRARSTWE